jgi:hypothetical protein
LKSVGTASLARLVHPGGRRDLRDDQKPGDLTLPCCRQARKDGFLLRAKRDIAAAKTSSDQRQGRWLRTITLDGYQGSRRAAREILNEHGAGSEPNSDPRNV